MEQVQTLMDPFSEYGLYIEDDDYPKTDFTQMQFTGPIDVAALSEAWEESARQFPIFLSHLFERRRGLLYEPYWEVNPELRNRLIVEDCRHLVQEPFDPMEFFSLFHATRMRRRLDLRTELPVTPYLIRIADDKHIFSICYHHSAFDPYKGYKVITSMLARYHEKVKGRPPPWAEAVGMAALGEQPKSWSLPRNMILSYSWGNLTKILRRVSKWGKAPALWASEIRDYHLEKGRHSLRYVIDDQKLLEGLYARAKREKAKLNDLILAIAHGVIARWNKEHDSPYQYFRMALISNLKGRMALPEHIGAAISGFTFITGGLGEANLEKMISFFRDERDSQLKRGLDVLFRIYLEWWIRKFRIFPINVRRKIWRPTVNGMMCPFYLSNVGVVWPKIVDGRPTMDSVLLGAGDFIIDDIHSSPSISRNVGIGMTVRTHNRRFYMNFVCDRYRFRAHEAQELVRRIVEGVHNAV
jgi:NRPS condensation-like uncharacterized protein